MKQLLSFSIPGPSGTSQIIDAPENIVDPGSLNLLDLIAFGISLMFAVGIILSLIFLMWGGLSWTTSGGDAEKIDKARKTLIYAIVGLVVIMLSIFLIQTIGLLFEWNFLSSIGQRIFPETAPPAIDCNPGMDCQG